MSGHRAMHGVRSHTGEGACAFVARHPLAIIATAAGSAGITGAAVTALAAWSVLSDGLADMIVRLI